MSAICGLWRRDGRPDAGAAVAGMQAALQSYGPDHAGHWEAEDGAFALGCRLMRLVPEDRHDRQPLADESGRFHLVADARIDNRDSLAVDLGIPAARLSSRCCQANANPSPVRPR